MFRVREKIFISGDKQRGMAENALSFAPVHDILAGNAANNAETVALDVKVKQKVLKRNTI